MPDSARSFWVNTVSLDHVLGGVAGGFTQADHGANTRLRRLRPGDGLVFYSPRPRSRAASRSSSSPPWAQSRETSPTR